MPEQTKENLIDNLMVKYALEGRSEEACRALLEEAYEAGEHQAYCKAIEMLKPMIEAERKMHMAASGNKRYNDLCAALQGKIEGTIESLITSTSK